MSKKNRRKFSAEFKAQVGLEALRGVEPVQAIAAKHEVHPVQVSQWKKEVLERLPEVFTTKAPPSVAGGRTRSAALSEDRPTRDGARVA